MTAAELNPDLRTLIDERLDAIDRMLLRAQVSYSERRSIVAEVETQIFELLSRKTDNPTREDVVAVLDSLDPPESYVPEELRGRVTSRPIGSPREPARPLLSRRAIGMVASLIAGGVFVVAVVIGNAALIAFAAASENVIPWIITVACLLYLNYRVLPRLWHLYSKRRGTIAEDVRASFASWLVPENGAQAS